MCTNINELSQTVVIEQSLETIYMVVGASIAMKGEITTQDLITKGICKLCE